MVVALGELGDFSAAAIRTYDSFILDAAPANTGNVTLGDVRSEGYATISMGAGTGQMHALSIQSEQSITIDASQFGGDVDVGYIDSNASTTIAIGPSGDFSGHKVDAVGNFVLDASNTVSAGYINLGGWDWMSGNVGHVSASNILIALGSNSGASLFRVDILVHYLIWTHQILGESSE